MAPQPGTTNNPRGGKPDKLIRDALMGAIRQSPEKLKQMAENVLSKAAEGDQAAINYISDRIDGKAVQPIAGSLEDDPIQVVQRIERVILNEPAGP